MTIRCRNSGMDKGCVLIQRSLLAWLRGDSWTHWEGIGRAEVLLLFALSIFIPCWLSSTQGGGECSAGFESCGWSYWEFPRGSLV